MPTYIRFGDDHSVAVQETLAEVGRLIEETGSANVPLFEVTRTDGAKLLVNAREVRTISAGRARDAEKKS